MSASSDERLSRTIEGAFRLTLTESAGSDECVFLADLATELRSEGVSPPFAITADNLERVLFARLSTPQNAFPEGAWRRDPEAAPFAWLVRSYLRCFHASRKSASSKDLQEKQAALLAAANELCVSYCGLLLNPARLNTSGVSTKVLVGSQPFRAPCVVFCAIFFTLPTAGVRALRNRLPSGPTTEPSPVDVLRDERLL